MVMVTTSAGWLAAGAFTIAVVMGERGQIVTCSLGDERAYAHRHTHTHTRTRLDVRTIHEVTEYTHTHTHTHLGGQRC
jgi:uncharacterized caspase-like protein